MPPAPLPKLAMSLVRHLLLPVTRLPAKNVRKFTDIERTSSPIAKRAKYIKASSAPLPIASVAQQMLLSYVSQHANDALKFTSDDRSLHPVANTFLDDAAITALPFPIDFQIPLPDSVRFFIEGSNKRFTSLTDLQDAVPQIVDASSQKIYFSEFINNGSDTSIQLRAWWENQVYKLIEFLHTPDENEMSLMDNIVSILTKSNPKLNDKKDEELQRELTHSYIKLFKFKLLEKLFTQTASGSFKDDVTRFAQTQMINILIDNTLCAESTQTKVERELILADLKETMQLATKTLPSNSVLQTTAMQAENLFSAYLEQPKSSQADAWITAVKFKHVANKATQAAPAYWETRINQFLEKLTEFCTFGMVKLSLTLATKIDQACKPTPPTTPTNDLVF
jgi:hypothetical protein